MITSESTLTEMITKLCDSVTGNYYIGKENEEILCCEIQKSIQNINKVNTDLLTALKLALSSYNKMLSSMPPQSAWLYYNVDGIGREAIKHAEETQS